MCKSLISRKNQTYSVKVGISNLILNRLCTLSPFQGLVLLMRLFRGFTPPSVVCRTFGAFLLTTIISESSENSSEDLRIVSRLITHYCVQHRPTLHVLLQNTRHSSLFALTGWKLANNEVTVLSPSRHPLVTSHPAESQCNKREWWRVTSEISPKSPITTNCKWVNL